MEGHLPGTRIFAASIELDGKSAFAEVGGNDFEIGTGFLALQSDGNLYRNARVAPPFPLHKSARGAKAGLGPLGRDRLIKDEMRTHVEGGAEAGMAIHDGDRDGAFVAWGVARTFKDGGGDFQIGAIDNDGFEAAASQLPDGTVWFGAVL